MDDFLQCIWPSWLWTSSCVNRNQRAVSVHHTVSIHKLQSFTAFDVHLHKKHEQKNIWQTGLLHLEHKNIYSWRSTKYTLLSCRHLMDSCFLTSINCMTVSFRYTPQMIELDHKLKPFIPDFIPAVGDIDAFLKVSDNFQIWTGHECPIFSFWIFPFNSQVPRPDGKADNLGLLVLDEPCTKQSDPTVLSLWLSDNSKQHNVAVSSHTHTRRLKVLWWF